MGGINVAVDWSGRKVGYEIKTALKHRTPYLIVFGEEEVKSKNYKLKYLNTGEEKVLSREEVIKEIQEKLKKC
jgi:threonyl-tRNA synthetase